MHGGRTFHAILPVLVPLLYALGCSSSTTAPSVTTPSSTTVNAAGTWLGTTCQSPQGRTGCVFSLSLVQTGSSVSGAWTNMQVSGTLTGTLTGSQLVLSMSAAPSVVCPPSVLTATIAGTEMSGTLNGACGTSSLSASRQ